MNIQQGGESARGRTSQRWISQAQEVNKPGSEWARGEKARGQISQGTNRPGTKQARGRNSQERISQGANRQRS